jgi:hydrogenase maturation protease
MSPHQVRVLILACGNSLRCDDGVGPWLAEWAEEKFSACSDLRVISSQQWTPELAHDLACAESAIFIDCSIASAPGSVNLLPVHGAKVSQALATHHLGAPELLALSQDIYGEQPRRAFLLTIGAGSVELGEEFSAAGTAALPGACRLLKNAIEQLLNAGSEPA